MNNKNFIENEKARWEKTGKGIKRKILGYDEQLMMVLVDFNKGAVGSLHKHHHRQVTYVSKGKFETIIGKEKKILKEGDSFFIPPGVEHGVICIEKGTLIDVFTPTREDFLKK
jgi:quercetin dioxygenase-like cupin family protein